MSELDKNFVKSIREGTAMADKTPLENAMYGFETLVNEVERLESVVKGLQSYREKYLALQEHGVDNWGGYGDAMASLEEDE